MMMMMMMMMIIIITFITSNVRQSLFRKQNPCSRFYSYFGLFGKSSLLLFSAERMMWLTALDVWNSSHYTRTFFRDGKKCLPCTTCLVFITNWISVRVALTHTHRHTHTRTHIQRLLLKWSSCNATPVEWPLQTACASWQFIVEEILQMTGRSNFPTTCAVYSLSVGEIIAGDSALLEKLDGTCDVKRTATMISDCARTGSC